MSMRHEVSKLVAVSSYATTSARSRNQALPPLLLHVIREPGNEARLALASYAGPYTRAVRASSKEE